MTTARMPLSPLVAISLAGCLAEPSGAEWQAADLSAGCCHIESPAGCRDSGCPDGEVCTELDFDACGPSSCSRDHATGGWDCSSDCVPLTTCLPAAATCEGDSPAGCRVNGCDPGQTCLEADFDGCSPSSCRCDETTGTWLCDDQCLAPMVYVDLVNINHATAEELEALPFIGEWTAIRIVEYRDANGPFSSIWDLASTRVIDVWTITQIADLITI